MQSSRKHIVQGPNSDFHKNDNGAAALKFRSQIHNPSQLLKGSDYQQRMHNFSSKGSQNSNMSSVDFEQISVKEIKQGNPAQIRFASCQPVIQGRNNRYAAAAKMAQELYKQEGAQIEESKDDQQMARKRQFKSVPGGSLGVPVD